MGRDVSADFRNFVEFGDTFGVGFRFCLFFGEVGVAVGKNNHGIAGDRHGFELLGFVGGFVVVEEIQAIEVGSWIWALKSSMPIL